VSPILYEVALWALALASTITVGQRIWLVRSQALGKRVPE
jgi:CDP-diacylglycerol--glycerol-3-phosphate 3-phosphatidyltransferase/CDP-diacylglycerol--inositol 3-phosphatidyltransferase